MEKPLNLLVENSVDMCGSAWTEIFGNSLVRRPRAEIGVFTMCGQAFNVNLKASGFKRHAAMIFEA